MNYQPMSLAPSHDFVARRLVEHPDVAVLTPPSLGFTIEREYHDVLRQMEATGVRSVVVDVSNVKDPNAKLFYANMRPCSCEYHKGPNIRAMPVVGITQEDLNMLDAEYDRKRAPLIPLIASDPKLGLSSFRREVKNVPGFAATLDDAVAECLRN